MLQALGWVSCHIQEGHPAACPSETFTSSQKNYAKIEKELAAVLYGCQRFHHYVFGKEIVVETDHKPLQSILKTHWLKRHQDCKECC